MNLGNREQELRDLEAVVSALRGRAGLPHNGPLDAPVTPFGDVLQSLAHRFARLAGLCCLRRLRREALWCARAPAGRTCLVVLLGRNADPEIEIVQQLAQELVIPQLIVHDATDRAQLPEMSALQVQIWRGDLGQPFGEGHAYLAKSA